MADNTELNAGAGGDIIMTEQPGGVGPKIPVSKLIVGARDVDGGDVSDTNPLPIKLRIRGADTSDTNPYPIVPLLLRGGVESPDAARCQTTNNIASSQTPQDSFGVQLVDRPAVIAASVGSIFGGDLQTITVPALTGSIFVVTALSASVAAGVTAQTPTRVTLISNSVVKWTGWLSCPANSTAQLALGGISLPGELSSSVTLAFSGATVAGAYGSVNIAGYYA